jgi:hypothetical protein
LLDRYLHAINQGMQNSQAFTRAFGTGYTEFEEAWKKYMTTVKPDPVSAAATKLDVLGYGLRMLLRDGTTVSSFQELEAELKASNFKVTFGSHSGVHEVSAQDPGMFQPPDSGDPFKAAKFLLTPSKDPRLPAGLAVEGLRVKIRLKWSLTGKGTVNQDVVFE